MSNFVLMFVCVIKVKYVFNTLICVILFIPNIAANEYH